MPGWPPRERGGTREGGGEGGGAQKCVKIGIPIQGRRGGREDATSKAIGEDPYGSDLK